MSWDWQPGRGRDGPRPVPDAVVEGGGMRAESGTGYWVLEARDSFAR